MEWKDTCVGMGRISLAFLGWCLAKLLDSLTTMPRALFWSSSPTKRSNLKNKRQII